MEKPNIVSQSEWLKARTALLEKEKAFTRARDQLSQEIRSLPWVKIEQDYQFQTDRGPQSFSDLFEGRSQLIVYHFMMGPEWKAGCKSCSFWADNFERNVVHLNARDVTLTAISRAPMELILPFKARMGWTFPWASSAGSTFNYDFNVSGKADEAGSYNFKAKAAGKAWELPGISVFVKGEAGEVYHTYSRYARGLDLFNAAYHYLDIVPKGRDEAELPYGMAWLRHRDSYEGLG